MICSIKKDVNRHLGGIANTERRVESQEMEQDWECERGGKRLEPMEKEFMEILRQECERKGFKEKDAKDSI